MSPQILPFLWFDQDAKELASFYKETFPESSVQRILHSLQSPGGELEIYSATLWGSEFQLMKTKRPFSFTPAISFHVSCSTREEVDQIWKAISREGTILMELGEYPFSKHYGWLADRFGVSWQIDLVSNRPVTQRIHPALLFTGEQYTHGEEALAFYTSIFPNSRLEMVSHFEKGEEPDLPGRVKYAEFSLNGYRFSLMESGYPHEFTFTEAISFVVLCETQEELDKYWETLSAFTEAEACGWLKDRFGISWQILPNALYEMEQSADPERIMRMYQALLSMKKLNISELQKAFNG